MTRGGQNASGLHPRAWQAAGREGGGGRGWNRQADKVDRDVSKMVWGEKEALMNPCQLGATMPGMHEEMDQKKVYRAGG